MLKRALSIMLLLPLFGAGNGKQYTVPQWGQNPQAASGPCFTDNFPGSSGAALSSKWAVVSGFGAGVFVQDGSGNAKPPAWSEGANIVSGSSCTFPLDQYAQFTLTNKGVSNEQAALLVLMTSSGNGYRAFINNPYNNMYIQKCTSGTCSNLTVTGTCPSVTSGYLYKFVVTGSGGSQTLTIWYNSGSGWTSTCYVQDSTYTSGYPGIYGLGEGPTLRVGGFVAD
jgi:hypothetical protein